MRPMAAFVEIANRFSGTVNVKRLDSPEQEQGSDCSFVNGRSILGLMGLAAEQGTQLVIEVTGPGAEETMRALVDVLHRHFDEEP